MKFFLTIKNNIYIKKVNINLVSSFKKNNINVPPLKVLTIIKETYSSNCHCWFTLVMPTLLSSYNCFLHARGRHSLIISSIYVFSFIFIELVLDEINLIRIDFKVK